MEAALRVGIFLSIFVVVAIAEWKVPKKARVQSRWDRWRINIGILVLDVIVQRLTLGAAAYFTAVYAHEHGWGLFNALDWPPLVEGILAFLILDFAIYLQHVMSHALPAFWRLHQVHHADLDVDLTTGTRFHPLEILISLVYKAMLVAALGVDPWVVVIFEAVLNGSAVYTHGNIRIPEKIDRVLRWLFCTPDMHRVHHSVIPEETNSNFGFFLSIWDRLGGTMRHAPIKGHDGVEIGLAEYRDPKALRLRDLLILPFRGAIGSYSFGKQSGVDRPPEKAQTTPAE
jgi:sterol desaturase/sphingolipid hydroxylase (fatty acid hydroxylase superfamily)